MHPTNTLCDDVTRPLEEAMLELLASPEAWIALATLALLEIVLGIDNLVFIAIVTGRLPEEQQAYARRLGLAVALLARLLLLFTLSWVLGLTKPLIEFHLMDRAIELTGRSMILLGGGLFLIWKATTEIYAKTEIPEDDHGRAGAKRAASFGAVIANIVIMDIIFSLDSVITAVGMVNEIALMVIAIVIAMGVMIAFAKSVSAFVDEHPSVKILALAFLLLIGVLLTAEAFEVHVPKGYVYFALSFSLAVELVQLRYKRSLALRAGRT